MTEMMWYLLLVISFFLILVIAVLEYNEFPYYYPVMFTILDIILWFLLASAVFELEIPYVFFNSTSSQVESGVEIVTSKISPEMSYFCMMMGSSMMAYSAYLILSAFELIGNKEED